MFVTLRGVGKHHTYSRCTVGDSTLDVPQICPTDADKVENVRDFFDLILFVLLMYKRTDRSTS